MNLLPEIVIVYEIRREQHEFAEQHQSELLTNHLASVSEFLAWKANRPRDGTIIILYRWVPVITVVISSLTLNPIITVVGALDYLKKRTDHPMNGHEEHTLTSKEIYAMLKEKKRLRCQLKQMKIQEHRDYVVLCVILSIGIIFIMFVVALWYFKPTNTRISWVQSTELNDDEWFKPAFSHDMLDVERALNERWQIGLHTYTTRDLMGRNI